MVRNDIYHGDLFDASEPDAEPVATAVPRSAALPLLAIPCGFRNRRNARCRRLGSRPVTIDGEPFHHRGHRIIHCDFACFRGEVAGATGVEPAADERTGGEAEPVG